MTKIKTKIYPIVKIEQCEFEENSYAIGDKTWKVKTLVQAVKDQGCEVFDIPLSALNLNILPFNVDDISDFIYQSDRVQKTDLKYPIILDWNGFICDGWHRVIKAILLKKTIIKAYRLKEYVMYDCIDKDI